MLFLLRAFTDIKGGYALQAVYVLKELWLYVGLHGVEDEVYSLSARKFCSRDKIRVSGK